MSDPVTGMYTPPQAAPPQPPPVPVATHDWYARIALAVAFAAAIGVAVLPRESGNQCAIGMAVVTAMLCGIDARRWGLGGVPQAILIGLLWWLMFPLYFHERAKKGAPRLLPVALLAAIAHFALGVYVRWPQLTERVH